ncbi:MAG: hypothetical protein CK424_06595 [Legionella sp.]|nr:MAG: hypothetical protein CK424_06595 [Legionella sp.]
MMHPSMTFSQTKTILEGNWICTTNASTGTTSADKEADERMKHTTTAISDAFSFASSNCRDCTKITCDYVQINQ